MLWFRFVSETRLNFCYEIHLRLKSQYRAHLQREPQQQNGLRQQRLNSGDLVGMVMCLQPLGCFLTNKSFVVLGKNL